MNDDALEDATYEYLDRLSLLVEPSGAAPLAAVRAGRVDVRGRTVVLVVSGGNATPALVARIAGERAATRNDSPAKPALKGGLQGARPLR